jgi:hypothetical protein
MVMMITYFLVKIPVLGYYWNSGRASVYSLDLEDTHLNWNHVTNTM